MARKISHKKAREIAYEIAYAACVDAIDSGHCAFQVSTDNAKVVEQELSKIISRLQRYANTDELEEYQ